MTNRHRNLFVAASLLTYLLVTLGGVVCVTDASRGCPDWPACYGQLVPPLRFDSILEYTHRVVAALTSLLIVASAIVGWGRYRANRWLWQPLAIAIGFLLVVIVLGALVVLRGLEPGLAALDLGSALMVQALVTAAAVVAVSGDRGPARPLLAGGLARWALVATWIVLVSGVLVAESGSAVRCLSWPLYGGEANLAAGQAREWLGWARRAAGALAAILILAVVVQAWRVRGGQRGLEPVAAALGLSLAAELVVGGVLAGGSGTLALQVVYVALAAALWPLLVALWVVAGLRTPTVSS